MKKVNDKSVKGRVNGINYEITEEVIQDLKKIGIDPVAELEAALKAEKHG